MDSKFILGLLIVLGALLFASTKFRAYKIEREGELVKMQIIEMPVDCGSTKSVRYMKAKYGETVFSKRISSRYCETHNIGEIIEMKYLEESSIIMFPDERTSKQFIAIGFLGLLGLIMIIMSFIYPRRKKTGKKFYANCW